MDGYYPRVTALGVNLAPPLVWDACNTLGPTFLVAVALFVPQETRGISRGAFIHFVLLGAFVGP